MLILLLGEVLAIRFGWPTRINWKRAAIVAGCVLAGLLFYGYSPLASSTNPPMNWGYAATKQGFLHAVTRGQYEKLSNPLQLTVDTKNVPLELYEARNAVLIARSFGADKYAADTYGKAEASLMMAERYPRDEEYWNEVIRFEPMVKYGTISPEDLNLFYRTDSVDDAFNFLVKELETHVLGKGGNGEFLADKT